MTILNANEYITKGDVMQILQKAYTEGRIQAKDGCASVLDDIGALKVADVQPVKHGKWEKKKGYLVCNNCGMTIDTIGYTYEEQDEVFRYCQCCGFRMDGDTECQ